MSMAGLGLAWHGEAWQREARTWRCKAGHGVARQGKGTNGARSKTRTMTQYGIWKMGLLDRFLNWIGLRPTKKEIARRLAYCDGRLMLDGTKHEPNVVEGIAKLYRELSTEGGTTEARYPERDYGPIPIVPASRLKMDPSPEVPSEVASEVSEVGPEVPEATPNASEVPEVATRPVRIDLTTESELTVTFKATQTEVTATESVPLPETGGIVGIEGPELLIPKAVASAFDIYRERRKP